LSAFRSADGIHWLPAAENPVMGINPDGPVGLHRQPDGLYVAYHRPCWGDRRIARTESRDFINWTRPRVVLEPEPGDGTNVQFYGLGATSYGPYEIGTLWVYRTDPECLGWTKHLGWVAPEFVYSRGGYAWHRAALGQSCVERSTVPDTMGYGLVQAVSRPLLLDNEIRFYFTASITRHGEDHLADDDRPARGVSLARARPDRFVGAYCEATGMLLTRPFWHAEPRFFVNAHCEPDGCLRAELQAVDGTVLPGFELERSVPAQGDDVSLELCWQGEPDYTQLRNRELRVRVEARKATVFAIAAGQPAEVARYDVFQEPHFLPRALETYEQPRH
jgi:hypothetical protein